MTISKAQMEKGLQKFLEIHHPMVGNITKVKYSPRRKVIFEARKSRGGVRLIFSVKPTNPQFQFYLAEAVRALKEIHYETTSAIAVRERDER